MRFEAIVLLLSSAAATSAMSSSQTAKVGLQDQPMVELDRSPDCWDFVKDKTLRESLNAFYVKQEKLRQLMNWSLCGEALKTKIRDKDNTSTPLPQPEFYIKTPQAKQHPHNPLSKYLERQKAALRIFILNQAKEFVTVIGDNTELETVGVIKVYQKAMSALEKLIKLAAELNRKYTADEALSKTLKQLMSVDSANGSPSGDKICSPKLGDSRDLVEASDALTRSAGPSRDVLDKLLAAKFLETCAAEAGCEDDVLTNFKDSQQSPEALLDINRLAQELGKTLKIFSDNVAQDTVKLMHERDVEDTTRAETVIPKSEPESESNHQLRALRNVAAALQIYQKLITQIADAATADKGIIAKNADLAKQHLKLLMSSHTDFFPCQ
jgi:hypothetical protein